MTRNLSMNILENLHFTDIFLFVFFMSQVLTMKLTESTNICYVNDRVACTIKMNVKETFTGNDSFRKC